MEEVWVACARVEKPIPPVPGSIIMNCSKCGADVWLSPALQMEFDRLFLGKEVKFMCIVCYFELVKFKPKKKPASNE